MICAETTKIRVLTVVQQLVWKAYQPFIPPQLPNLMVQAESADLYPVSYKKMNECPNLTLEVHSIWTHTIASERTKNQAKRTIIEWVMVGHSFCKHKDSATFDRIWKLLCHHRIFFLPLLAQFLIVSHDFWCFRKRLYMFSFCGLNSSHSFCKQKNSAAESFHRKNLGDSARRIFLLVDTVAIVNATEAACIQSLPNSPKIMRNYQELSE